MSYVAETFELYRSKLDESRLFPLAECAEAHDRALAARTIRAAPIEEWDAAIETGAGPLADALRLLAPEMPMSSRRRVA